MITHWVCGIVWIFGPACAFGLSEICREQLEMRQVPVACYAEVFRKKTFRNRRVMTDFLDSRCRMHVSEESRLSLLDDLVRHPLLSLECRHSVERRRERVRYARQDAHPVEVMESLVDEAGSL